MQEHTSGGLVPVPVPGTDRQIMATVVNGTPMVSLRHVCDAVGIDPENQRRKLAGKSWAVAVMSTAGELLARAHVREAGE